MPANGCNSSVLISLIMATLVILFLVVMEGKSTHYAIPVSEFSPQDVGHHRLEGEIRNTLPDKGISVFSLCDKETCIPVHLILPEKIQMKDRVIVEGDWDHDIFNATEVLRRCDQVHQK